MTSEVPGEEWENLCLEPIRDAIAVIAIVDLPVVGDAVTIQLGMHRAGVGDDEILIADVELNGGHRS